MFVKRTVTAKLILYCLLAILAAGCGMAPANNSKIEKEVNVVTICAVLPRSGSLAMVGLEAMKGMNLAVEIINLDMPDLAVTLAKGAGLPNLNNAKVRIVSVDHQGNAVQARNETERIIIQEKCVALLGTYSEDTAISAASVAERYGVPFLDDSPVSPSSSHAELHWYFRTAADDVMLSTMIHPFFRSLKEKDYIQEGKIAYLHPDTEASKSIVALSVKQSREYKYNVVAEISLGLAGQALAADGLATKLKTSGASVVWQYSGDAETRDLLKSYKEKDFNPEGIILLKALSRDEQQALGKEAMYTTSVDRWAPDMKDKKSLFEKVSKLYRQRFGNDMGEYAVRAFTSVLIVCDAINRAGATDSVAVRSAIKVTDIPGNQLLMPWKGVKFDSKTNHNTLAAGIITQVREKQRVTVWPPAAASVDVLWPMPRWKDRNKEAQ